MLYLFLESVQATVPMSNSGLGRRSDPFIQQDPNVSRYSRRLSKAQWDSFKDRVIQWYTAGWTCTEILNELELGGVQVTRSQLDYQFRKWGINKLRGGAANSDSLDDRPTFTAKVFHSHETGLSQSQVSNCLACATTRENFPSCLHPNGDKSTRTGDSAIFDHYIFSKPTDRPSLVPTLEGISLTAYDVHDDGANPDPVEECHSNTSATSLDQLNQEAGLNSISRSLERRSIPPPTTILIHCSDKIVT